MVRSRNSNSLNLTSNAANKLYLLHMPLPLKEAEEKHTKQETVEEGEREAIASG